MGGIRLVEVLSRLRSHKPLKSHIKLSALGATTHFREKNEVDPNSTIWLFADRTALNIAERNSSVATHYICYEQEYTACSTLVSLDEDKPGWLDHVTCPHSLTAAMLNVAMSHRSEPVVYDPFVGSGTTVLEAMKFANANGIGTDINSFSPAICRFNERFVSSDDSQIDRWIQFLEGVRQYQLGRKIPAKLKEQIQKSFEEAQVFASSKDLANGTFHDDRNSLEEIDDETLLIWFILHKGKVRLNARTFRFFDEAKPRRVHSIGRTRSHAKLIYC